MQDAYNQAYDDGQADLARDVLAIFGPVIRHPMHAYSCAVAVHNRHAQQIFGGGPKRGPGGRVKDGDRAAHAQAVAEYEAKRPACTCYVKDAVSLLAKLEKLARPGAQVQDDKPD
ncbi:hypothetical protein H1O16_gp068 [Burkholderia phage BcepSaruman]|uniref:Uncharacterized protein n=1 Tax=Burkholderia phage BcepSaruman TaxID=2530032 RepID=A0A4D5ZCG8_9CAUD|nr:hypothetical protein H1O16_gp068 [Burkholderia phage BcepSaruman]QBX06481.1 hypothetical protein BcepSaruman_068 [Burkholderia phage BcepSaruman]